MGRNFTERGRQRRSPRCALAAVACLVGGAMAVPASAQETASSQAKTAVVQPLSLAKTDDMDFGQVAVTGAGTVVMTASATPSCTVTGAIAKYGLCQNAVFEGYGQTGRSVRLKVPGSQGITITGPGGATMKITNVATSGGTTLGPPTTGNASSNGFRRHQIVSPDGAFELRVGGTLNIAAGQALGLYTGTFDVEIAYE
jgi:hypothetical protein